MIMPSSLCYQCGSQLVQYKLIPLAEVTSTSPSEHCFHHISQPAAHVRSEITERFLSKEEGQLSTQQSERLELKPDIVPFVPIASLSQAQKWMRYTHTGALVDMNGLI